MEMKWDESRSVTGPVMRLRRETWGRGYDADRKKASGGTRYESTPFRKNQESGFLFLESNGALQRPSAASALQLPAHTCMKPSKLTRWTHIHG